MIPYNIYSVETPVLQCNVTLAWLRVQYSRAFVCECTASGLCLELWPLRMCDLKSDIITADFEPWSVYPENFPQVTPHVKHYNNNILLPASPSHIFLFISLVLLKQSVSTYSMSFPLFTSYSTYSWVGLLSIFVSYQLTAIIITINVV